MLKQMHISKASLLLRLAVAFAFSSPLLAPSFQAAEPSTQNDAPIALLCESMTEPLGLGITQPRWSWRLMDARRGARQTAYQIRVSTSMEKLAHGQADVWDSGKVVSSDSIDVAYAGAALTSRGRYYWQVRVWDGEEKA